jgi:outer membrane protein
LLLAADASAQVVDVPTTVGVDPSLEPRQGVAPDEWRWTLGLGPALVPDYEGSEDYRLAILPFAQAKKDQVRVWLVGTHLRSNLIDHPNWLLGPSLNYRQGYGDVENKRVDDLDDREGSLELGFEAGYVVPFQRSSLEFRTEFLHDVTSGHDGYVINPAVWYNTKVSERWGLRMRGDFSVASGDYMSHYFSVSQNDAADTGLDSFNADADVKNAGLLLVGSYRFAKAWDLSLFGAYNRLLGDAADSPVVEDEGDENNVLFGAIVSYTW